MAKTYKDRVNIDLPSDNDFKKDLKVVVAHEGESRKQWIENLVVKEVEKRIKKYK